MKRDLTTLALGVVIGAAVGMGVGPALALSCTDDASAALIVTV